MRIEYHETTLETIIKYYKEGFKLKKGESIWSSETFCDPSGKTIIKLFIEEKEKDGQRNTKSTKGMGTSEK